MGIVFDSICTDDWQSFISVFCSDNHIIEKSHTVGIEGNNCRLKHRIRELLEKFVVSRKKSTIILKLLTWFFYINFGYV